MNNKNLHQRSKDIAHFQRIDRGHIREGDEKHEFKTIKDSMSPIEIEHFEKRVKEKLSKGVKNG